MEPLLPNPPLFAIALMHSDKALQSMSLGTEEG